MVLQGSHLVQVIIIDLVVGVIVPLVQLYVCNRVCVANHR